MSASRYERWAPSPDAKLFMRVLDVQCTFDWLVDGAPGANGPAEVVARLCGELTAAGVPLSHAEAFVRTLHPSVAGRSFRWLPGKSVEVVERSYAWLHSPEFLDTALGEACRAGDFVRQRLGAEDAREETFVGRLARAGVADIVAAPLKFLTGESHVMTFCTRDPAGFSPQHLQALWTIVPPLSRIAEILALHRTAANLLSAYVGRDAGNRILAGKVKLGDTESIRAVIWLSDLRGFTSLAQQVSASEMIALLNELFACQVPSIEAAGGEVLKFIGDGLLAIFPFDEDAQARERCDAALDAARSAQLSLAMRNAGAARKIAFGIGLHLGEFSYGNIGTASRLDFTSIGPAVNLAARLESVTAKLGRAIVLSEPMAKRTSRPTEELGVFELKGVVEKQRVFAPA